MEPVAQAPTAPTRSAVEATPETASVPVRLTRTVPETTPVAGRPDDGDGRDRVGRVDHHGQAGTGGRSAKRVGGDDGEAERAVAGHGEVLGRRVAGIDHDVSPGRERVVQAPGAR